MNMQPVAHAARNRRDSARGAYREILCAARLTSEQAREVDAICSKIDARASVKATMPRDRPAGSFVRNWTRNQFRAAVQRAGYRGTTHGHTVSVTTGPETTVTSTVDNVRPSSVGLPNAYARKAYSVASSTHAWTVGPDWLRTVRVRGAAVVGGMVTLTLAERETEPAIYAATWVEQSRGAALRIAAGFLVRVGHGWKHADTIVGARRVTRPAKPTVSLSDMSAAGMLRRARLTGREIVAMATARRPGHCMAGIRDWMARHGLADRETITTRELAEIAAGSRDRVAEVYLVLRAARVAETVSV